MARRKNNIRGLVRGSQHPETIQSTSIIRKKFRFFWNGGSATIGSNALLSMLCMTATTTTSYVLGSFFKLNKVEIWGPSTADTSGNFMSQTVEVEYLDPSGVLGTKPLVVNDTSMGGTYSAHVAFAPPRLTTAEFWQDGSSTGYVYIAGPNESVVDFDVSISIQNGEAPIAGPTLSSGTPGTVFVNPPASGMVPQAYQIQT
jgi:hypothetical protein